ncbi:SET domain-containing protein-lysine N-methyltransferase [Fluviicola taffensis]|uniref:Nuclear protein SET n=1 Tax=Fluviicola taffensis (strain DSM 16823 / NCIMB 13979 / RW262) TaxID=755732 RepID=F2IA36_FLUTR|nr:SET domain-containing protein-lysine N-methyltransferase [Fluviicola taffensis]AEA45213.1 nuclear protein SET [Fluviicola taffensis DSM 16823]
MKNSTNQIEASESDYLYKSQSQIPNSGHGLFTVIKIYKDETIAIFKGEILTDLEAKTRAEAGNDGYFINLIDGTILDSKNVECFAKYANDAEGFSASNYKNNTRITLDLNDNVCIQALRNIQANEELFCSYGKGYWKKHG